MVATLLLTAAAFVVVFIAVCGYSQVGFLVRWLLVIYYIIMCLCVCLWALSPIGLNGRNDVLFAEKCIWLVSEKLTLFPYGQDIVGNVVLLAFWWYTVVRFKIEVGVSEKCTKM